ncbi:pantoate-beta-alanine ligase [Cladophialophora carrionii CBS 160.54]|uniref:Pantoate--beta-alanine ligase n=1 Tax=Cladophialophora carrionii CBS 160.54 TaxID=1279043 RepID=V9D538_9EURO|nr:pantoate-beta-alanine ligase [Cladophialophora carrionii CBS 160.54]ETI21388.1 pantoate-beta-alanine ligase [Cladophialophora carrionii CBS 160.54]
MQRAALRGSALRPIQRLTWHRGRPCRRYESSSVLARTHGSASPSSDASPFPVFRNTNELRAVRRRLLCNGSTVGFVPTMGALHEGHLSLVRRALKENSHVFVSIFVNPTQFAAHEDLDSYPVTWEEDLAKLKKLEEEYLEGAEAMSPRRPSSIRGIFAPTVKTMYPTLPPTSDIAGHGSFVTITPLGSELEGASRPIFFRGVATVCMKLFNIVQPDRVYFGQKDIQQSVLIKRLVRDFHIPTEVRVVATVREPDGLAMSSRNVYLGDKRREDATVLSRALFAAQDLYKSGVLQVKRLRAAAFDVFKEDATRSRSDGRVGPSGQIDVDYIAMSHPDTMGSIQDDEELNPNIGGILSAAMIVSPVDSPKTQQELNQRSVRLIDNVILEPKVDVKLRRERRQQAAARHAASEGVADEATEPQDADQQATQPRTASPQTFRKVKSLRIKAYPTHMLNKKRLKQKSVPVLQEGSPKVEEETTVKPEDSKA